MAAEILKTVLVRDLNELIVLGAVVLLRALLSLLIHFEMKEHPHLTTPGGGAGPPPRPCFKRLHKGTGTPYDHTLFDPPR